MPSNKKLLQAAAGSAGGEGLYPEDVFSTFLYTPTGNAGLAINNGLDLSGEGGLVWSKCRGVGRSHNFIDTNRGGTKVIKSNSTSGETTNANAITAFNSNGYTLGADTSGDINYAANTPMCSWSFRKAAGFCDIVTYTGNGVAGRNISHALGSSPKMMIVKRTDNTSSWWTWHVGIGTNYINLNSSNPQAGGGIVWNNTAPTSTVFTVADDANTNGGTFVAYLFGQDASFGENGDEQICKIDSYTGNGNNTGPIINCGFEPQWILVKKTSSTGGNKSWIIVDVMRGIVTGGDDAFLTPNESSAEFDFNAFSLTATGFQVITSNDYVNTNGVSYIYMAIRRPMKVPEAGTEVFSTVFRTATAPTFYTGFVTDMQIYTYLNGFQKSLTDRLRGQQELLTNVNNAESATGTQATYDWMTGVGDQDSASSNTIAWNFKRAPKFMDVIAYSGTNSAHTEVHNLNAVPQLMFVKDRDAANSWVAYSAATGPSICGFLNSTSDFFNVGTAYFNSTNPTSSVVTIGSNGSVNASGRNYIAYLFATLEGVSKVGSYEGNGSGQNIDCGFSNGARFVLLKDVDDSAHWNVYDTTRGISTGTSYQLSLNNSDAQSGATDQIEPYSGGFKVKTNAGTNASGHTFIFLAIA